MRGSRDFDTVDDYADFVQQLLERRNRLVKGKLEQEIPYLGPLPPAPLPESANYRSRVRRGCTIQADNLVNAASGATLTDPGGILEMALVTGDPKC